MDTVRRLAKKNKKLIIIASSTAILIWLSYAFIEWKWNNASTPSEPSDRSPNEPIVIKG